LNSKGIIDIIGSKDTIRSAFKNGIIENGEIWFDMIDSRNNTAHVYDEESAEKISYIILNKYMGAFRELKEKFSKYKSEAE
jgi:nucleotidyltransferase substrate binding protein (TIGR01987 family)